MASSGWCWGTALELYSVRTVSAQKALVLMHLGAQCGWDLLGSHGIHGKCARSLSSWVFLMSCSRGREDPVCLSAMRAGR